MNIFQSLSDMNPRFELMRDGAKDNMKEWALLAGVDPEEEEQMKAPSSSS